MAEKSAEGVTKMNNRWNLWAIIALCSLIMAACAPVVEEPAAGMPTTAPTPADEPLVPADLAPLVAEMRRELAGHSGSSADTVRLVTLKSVTWADGSLGCPEPGMMYTMALVEGYQLLWEAAGKTWHYHTAGTDRFIRCERPTDPVSQESHAPQPGQEALAAVPAPIDDDTAPSSRSALTPALPTPRPTRTPLPPTPTPQPRLEAPAAGQVTPVATLPLVQKEPSTTPLPVEQKVVPVSPVVVPAALEPLVAKMRNDLAGRSGVSADTIRLVEVKSVTWADGSIGCPEPGMMYTMALVEGYRLLWDAGNTIWHYHTAGTDRYLYCANPPGAGQPGGTTVYEE
jgi:hypothetical protein